MRMFNPECIRDLSQVIEDKVKGVKEIEVIKLNETEYISQFLVFIRTAELPHYHAAHDLTFVVVRGHGELYLDGKREKLSEGDTAFIPRGKVHFYTNTSVVSVLLATFSPSYDGKDSVKVEL
ncbi:quercetin dioxygenase-like cupin family protein [Hydrogenivirga caldilitoris]|uniref:Quercetin dioxygenase-like cupin family protein n=1 Tax=Hydrogenivirga caldilitoris TaxID=246264 RepID=A0A497XLW7_9AQUI|nr:cupin domain-containing protein [Hydrogenivirga caldilitoris]RLJ69778.1 quercetin dioxygenase-like cupin family protein [Hydrogenivirga caldilitoris]